MATSNRDVFINNLSFFWRDFSKKNPVTDTFSDVLNFYDAHFGNYVESLGREFRKIEQSKVQVALKSLDWSNGYPHPQLIFNALGASVQTISSADVTRITRDTLSEVNSLAKLGLSIPLIALGIGIIVFFFVKGKNARS